MKKSIDPAAQASLRMRNLVQARVRLSTGFISTQEITREFGIDYPDPLPEGFIEGPPDSAIKFCTVNNMVLLPGPPKVMSVTDLMVNWPGIIKYENTITDELFRRNPVMSRWMAFSRKPVGGDRPRPLNEQRELLLGSGLALPNIAEALWYLMVSVKVKTVDPFDTYARTVSMAANGEYLCLAFNSPHFEITTSPPERPMKMWSCTLFLV